MVDLAFFLLEVLNKERYKRDIFSLIESLNICIIYTIGNWLAKTNQRCFEESWRNSIQSEERFMGCVVGSEYHESAIQRASGLGVKCVGVGRHCCVLFRSENNVADKFARVGSVCTNSEEGDLCLSGRVLEKRKRRHCLRTLRCRASGIDWSVDRSTETAVWNWRRAKECIEAEIETVVWFFKNIPFLFIQSSSSSRVTALVLRDSFICRSRFTLSSRVLF